METHPSTGYRFGPFEVNAVLGELRRNAQPVRLQEQPHKLLVVLLENPGKVISREELRSRLWREDTFVDFDGSLRVAVRKVREALNDDADNPTYIETVPTVGYRFIGKLIAEEAKPPAHVDIGSPSRIRLWWVIATAAMVACGFTAWTLRPKPPLTAMSAPVPLTTYRGSQDAPSFSPDGNQVAFEWDGEKQNNYDCLLYTSGQSYLDRDDLIRH